MKKNVINICYTADENYAMQVAVSMVSMLENNRDKELAFYILADDYSRGVRERFTQIANDYQTYIEIIDIREKLKVFNNTKLIEEPGIVRNGLISYMFARLFMGSCLPQTIEKVVYIDCDTLYIGNIEELYETELEEGCLFAAVRDIWPSSYNKVLGLSEDELYFQSGIMLVNLKKWRENRCEDQLLEKAYKAKCYYYMHDMDLLNPCFHGQIQTLSPKYGMIYLLRRYNSEQCLWFAGKDEAHYYSIDEIDAAKEDVHVIHYAGDYYGRPWSFPKACRDNRLWLAYYKKTPWCNEPVGNKHSAKQWTIYFVKRVLEPFIGDMWLKRTKKRFETDNEMMLQNRLNAENRD